MPNTSSQISIQAIFAVKGRNNFLGEEWRQQLYRYISGIIAGQGAKSLAVGGWVDHVHIFFGLPPKLAVADLIEKIKACSSLWINESRFIKQKFQWQSGYGAFSYSKSQRDRVINYIMNQEHHHRQMKFKDEYKGFLKAYHSEFEDKYLFEFYD